ncbi:hypothetical protein [Mucilaginibacter sp. SMC90]|uniref:hypothetical protein n=1 Tax=Mucilaginibacter sp. SMC90 TaxID=2929803 RepID=UPI0035301A43
MKITQETNFPETERTTITVNQVNQPLFAINIRYPSWVRSQGLQIRVNDKPCEITAPPATFRSKGPGKKVT